MCIALIWGKSQGCGLSTVGLEALAGSTLSAAHGLMGQGGVMMGLDRSEPSLDFIC
jgi:hypothetical protein